MYKDSTNRKISGIIFCGIIGYIFIISLHVFYHPEKQEFNLNNFSGQILKESEAEITPKMFIKVAFEEAIKWGNDAILNYDKTGVRIYKQDSTSKVPLFARSNSDEVWGVYWYEVNIDNNNNMIIKARIDIVALISMGGILAFFTWVGCCYFAGMD